MPVNKSSKFIDLAKLNVLCCSTTGSGIVQAGKRHFRTDLSPETGEIQAWNDQLAVQLNGTGRGPSKAYTAAVEEVRPADATFLRGG